jgi:hypothetical protein
MAKRDKDTRTQKYKEYRKSILETHFPEEDLPIVKPNFKERAIEVSNKAFKKNLKKQKTIYDSYEKKRRRKSFVYFFCVFILVSILVCLLIYLGYKFIWGN